MRYLMLLITLAISSIVQIDGVQGIPASRKSFQGELIVTPTIISKIGVLSEKIILSPTPFVISKPDQTWPKPVLVFSKEDHIINEINSYRISKGLQSTKKEQFTCEFAKIRSIEISQSFSHDGFTNRINNKSLPYPSYSLITENMANNGDYKNVVSAWINSPSHVANIEKDTLYACVGNSGNFYVYESWRP